MFGTDPSNIAFNLYRNGTKINSTPERQVQHTRKPVSVWAQNYLQIPIQPPSSAYEANDCSAADLDGDGEYEIVLKWEPKYTDNVYLDAYKLNGTRLWRIDLGRNIRAGAQGRGCMQDS